MCNDVISSNDSILKPHSFRNHQHNSLFDHVEERPLPKANHGDGGGVEKVSASYRHDSSDATIVTMAQGYPLQTHRHFVGTLRQTGYSGRIMIAIEPDPESGVEEYLIANNVTMLKLQYVPCKTTISKFPHFIKGAKMEEGNTCIHPYPEIKVRWSRYPFLRDAIQNCEECTGPVLTTDYRDVFFQKDPFGDGVPEVTGLQLFAEHPRFITASHRFVSGRVKICKKGLKMKGRMICSGTTIGTREAILDYMTVMYQEMLLWQSDATCYNQTWHGGDQAILNYIYHSGGLDHLKPQVFEPREGIVNTVGIIGIRHTQFAKKLKNSGVSHQTYLGETTKRWISPHYDLTDSEGFFIDFNGNRSRVVHQYDRFNTRVFSRLFPELE